MMPKKPAPDLIRGVKRFSDDIMLTLLESITFMTLVDSTKIIVI